MDWWMEGKKLCEMQGGNATLYLYTVEIYTFGGL